MTIIIKRPQVGRKDPVRSCVHLSLSHESLEYSGQMSLQVDHLSAFESIQIVGSNSAYYYDNNQVFGYNRKESCY